MEITSLYENKTVKSEMNDQDKTEMIKYNNTPMGDFEFEPGSVPLSSDCSSSDFMEDVYSDLSSAPSKDVVTKLENDILSCEESIVELNTRLDMAEEDFLKKRDITKSLKRLFEDYVKEIKLASDQLEKANFMIEHLENCINTRQYAIDKFKLIESLEKNCCVHHPSTAYVQEYAECM